MAGELQLLVLQQYSPPVWPSTVTCTTQTAHLSYSALQIVSHYRLRYLCSYLHHTNSTPQLFCTAKCVTVQAQIFMQLPASQKQHTSVILHSKLCHSIGSDITCITETAHLSYSALQNVLDCYSTGSDIHAVTYTTQTAHLSYSALQNVSHYMLRYSSSYLQPQKQHTSVILHCKMCHTQIFLQLPAALEHCAYGMTDLYVDCKVMVISQVKM